MAVRWLTYTRRASQRLGFLKFVLEAASRQPDTNSDLVDAVASLVTGVVELPRDPQIEGWLKSFGERASVGWRTDGAKLFCELQAPYVYRHPSRSGWLSPKGIGEFVDTLPRRIGLVDESNGPSEAGTVFYRVLMTQDEREALRSLGGTNPLLITPGQAFYLFYYLLNCDGDLLLPMLGSMLNSFGSSSFSYLDAGGLLPDVIDRVMTSFSSSIYLDDDRRKISALEAARDRIRMDIDTKREREGSGSKREQTAVPRLEWLVDLGLLKREQEGGAPPGYRFTEPGRSVVSALAESYEERLQSGFADEALAKVLDRHYASAMAVTLPEQPPVRKPTPDTLLRLIEPTYRSIGSMTGYVLVRPLMLAALATQVNGQSRSVFEYDEMIDCLQQAYEQRPNDVHYTVDRLSTDYQVRLSS